MTNRIRTTISVDREVHEIFKSFAEATGVSVSRCMGDWLSETAEGAQFVAQKVQEAKTAPMRVLREFQGLTKHLNADVEKTIAEVQARPRQPAQGAAGGGGAAPLPEDAPSSNTGLKSHGKQNRGGLKGSEGGPK